MQFILKSFEEVVSVKRLANIHYFEFSQKFHGRPDRHPFRELVYVDNGSVMVHADGYTGMMQEKQMIIHEAGESHYLRCVESSTPNVIVIGFECTCPELDRFSDSPVTLPPALIYLLTEVVKNGRSVFQPPYDVPYAENMKKRETFPFGADQLIRLYLEMFLIQLIRRGTTEETELVNASLQSAENLLEIRQYIDANYCTNIRLGELCVLFRTNKTTLCSRFKEAYGVTIMEYVNNLRIRKAKILLREDRKNVTQIAVELGFNTVHYFSQIFKAHTHLTPTEYRASIKAQFENEQ